MRKICRILSLALAAGSALGGITAADGQAPSWKIGDVAEYAAVDLPVVPAAEKSGEDCMLERSSVSVPVLWKVAEVDEENGRMLLLSLHGIRHSSYCPADSLEYPEGCTFEGSSIDADVLNGLETDSLMQSVSEDELLPSGGENGIYFFIPDEKEALKYFPSPEDRLLYPLTASAAEGARTVYRGDLDSRNYGWWWLRTTGGAEKAPFVDFQGKVRREGAWAFHGGGMVRPGIWVKTGAFTGVKSPHGSTLLLGRWQLESGKPPAPVRWRVLAEDRDGRRLLVIADRGLEFMPFAVSGGEGDDPEAWDWRTSAARAFLNGDFLRKAFSPAERKRILKTRIASNPMIFAPGSSRSLTEDWIFLPDQSMVMRYMPEYGARNAGTTPLVAEKIKRHSASVGYDYSPLVVLRDRSTGLECYDGCTVMQHMENGHLSAEGSRSAMEPFVIRPAMWISSQE